MRGLTQQRSAFVTGATGCIGGALVARLSRQNWRVVALVRDRARAGFLNQWPNIEFIEGDLAERERIIVAMRGCDNVFHLAAKVHAAPDTPRSEFVRVNVEGTRNVVAAAIENRVKRFVLFSTIAVYAESDAMLDETSATVPATAYGFSKLEAERIVLESELTATALRLPVVYGARDRGNVSKLIDAIRRNRYFMVGDGRNLKSMVAVENAVDAALAVATAERASGVYIVTDERPYSQAEIAETIAGLLGRRQPKKLPRGPLLAAGRAADLVSKLTGIALPISADRVLKLSNGTRFSAARIERELGFKPRVGLREGLAEVINQDFKY
jgi:nucleoside-diphosphate-sugar epimerase